MSVVNTLPVPVIQMGLVEKLVDTAQNLPGMQQQAAQGIVLQALHNQSKQVQDVNSSEVENKIRAKDKEEQERKKRKNDLRKRSMSASALEPEDESSPHKANPWAGHIVNVRI